VFNPSFIGSVRTSPTKSHSFSESTVVSFASFLYRFQGPRAPTVPAPSQRPSLEALY